MAGRRPTTALIALVCVCLTQATFVPPWAHQQSAQVLAAGLEASSSADSGSRGCVDRGLYGAIALVFSRLVAAQGSACTHSDCHGYASYGLRYEHVCTCSEVLGV